VFPFTLPPAPAPAPAHPTRSSFSILRSGKLIKHSWFLSSILNPWSRLDLQGCQPVQVQAIKDQPQQLQLQHLPASFTF